MVRLNGPCIRLSPCDFRNALAVSMRLAKTGCESMASISPKWPVASLYFARCARLTMAAMRPAGSPSCKATKALIAFSCIKGECFASKAICNSVCRGATQCGLTDCARCPAAMNASRSLLPWTSRVSTALKDFLTSFRAGQDGLPIADHLQRLACHYDRFANLVFAMFGGDKEAQTRRFLRDRRVDDRLDIDPAYEKLL